MIVEFQYAFKTRIGMTDYDVVAEVNRARGLVEILSTRITATGRRKKLKPEWLPKAEELALRYADELWP